MTYNLKDPTDYIQYLTIYLGNRCNGSCTYCRDKLLPYTRPEITEENLLYMIQFILKFKNLKHITFVGGEPLLYIKAIETIVNTLQYKNITYEVITNGVLLSNDDVYDFLKEHLFFISLSHDGYNNEIYRHSNILNNKDIVNKLNFFNNTHHLSLQVVITKYNTNLLKNLYYFKQYFVKFKWRLMLVKGEKFSKDLQMDTILNNFKNFYKLFKYEPTVAEYLHFELNKFIPKSSKRNILFADLNLHIGYDPMDTIHTYSKENLIKYVIDMNNSRFPKCSSCSINNICRRNPSNCNHYIIPIREQLTNLFIEMVKNYGFKNFIDFDTYVMSFMKDWR